MKECERCGIRYFQIGPCPRCGPKPKKSAGEIYLDLTRDGILPIFTIPSEADNNKPLIIDTPAAMAAHGVRRPVVMFAVSEWEAETLAGTHDGIRDGWSEARCLRRFRAYYALEDIRDRLGKESSI